MIMESGLNIAVVDQGMMSDAAASPFGLNVDVSG